MGLIGLKEDEDNKAAEKGAEKKKTVTIGDNEQEYKIEKVMANGDVLISRDGKNIGTFSPNQLKPAEGDIRENEDEDNKAAEKDAKKEKKFAGKQKEAEDLKTKIEDKKAEMVKKAKEYKAAEGKAKEEIKDQLKKMTAERDELNKQLEKLKRVEV